MCCAVSHAVQQAAVPPEASAQSRPAQQPQAAAGQLVRRARSAAAHPHWRLSFAVGLSCGWNAAEVW